MIPEELKNYRAPDLGAFQKIPPDAAIALLIFGTVLGYVLGAFGRVAS